MATTVAAVAAVVTAAATATATVVNANQGAKNLKFSTKQLDIQKTNSILNAMNTMRDYEKSIADMEAQKIQYGIDIRDSQAQIDSYDKWLGNYSNQYAQEVQSKQAQTDALVAGGKETYENFLNAIGYADAMAGATGRVGAGTSQSHITQGIDRKLVDYVGEDRTLDATGGLFGSQLTAANMEMDQLKVDLEFQRYEAEQNRRITQESMSDWQRAIELTDQSIVNSKKSNDNLKKFIALNFM